MVHRRLAGHEFWLLRGGHGVESLICQVVMCTCVFLLLTLLIDDPPAGALSLGCDPAV